MQQTTKSRGIWPGFSRVIGRIVWMGFSGFFAAAVFCKGENAWFEKSVEMKRKRVVTEIDHRQAGRDSLFLMADLRIETQPGDHRVKVRNLSSRGMMAEGTVRVISGAGVAVNLRGLGWVSGRVAWIQDTRFGIAFVEEIDPRIVRAPTATTITDATPRYLKSATQPADPRSLRKL